MAADSTHISPADQAADRTRDLVERAMSGDRSAFNQLTVMYWEDIFRLVYYRLRSRMDAEDLTQEIFIKALGNISRLRKPDRFRSWLYTIGLNRIRDFKRKRRWLSFFGSPDDGQGPLSGPRAMDDSPSALDGVLRAEFWKKVEDFSTGLSPAEREVFMLRFMDQLTIREVAETMGRSQSAVKTHLYRAIAKFREKPGLLELLKDGQS